MKRLELPAPDGGYAYRQALREEDAALREYRQVLRIFTHLVLDGEMPDESDWHNTAGTE